VFPEKHLEKNTRQNCLFAVFFLALDKQDLAEYFALTLGKEGFS
jgi:hypothetical protein